MSQKRALRLYVGLLSCFLSTFLDGHGIAEGTLINTSYGNIPVEWLEKDDLVVSRNKTDETFVLKPVLACAKRAVSELIELSIGDTSLLVDPAQRFFVLAEHKWYAAKDLKPGQKLSKRKGGAAIVSGVKRIKKDAHVYELSIQDCHNFCVSGQEIIAHNFLVAGGLAALAYAYGAAAVTSVTTTVVAGATGVAGYLGITAVVSTTATAAPALGLTSIFSGMATAGLMIKGGSVLLSNAGEIAGAIGSVGSYLGNGALSVVKGCGNFLGGGVSKEKSSSVPSTLIWKPGPALPPGAKALPGVYGIPLGFGNNSNIALDALGKNLLSAISLVFPKNPSNSTPAVDTALKKSIVDRFAFNPSPNPQDFAKYAPIDNPGPNRFQETINRIAPDYEKLSARDKAKMVAIAKEVIRHEDSQNSRIVQSPTVIANYVPVVPVANLQTVSSGTNNSGDNHNAGNNGESKTQSGKGSPHPDPKKQVEPKKTITCAAGAGGMPPDEQWNQHNLNNPNDKSGPKVKPRTESTREQIYTPHEIAPIDVQKEVVSKFISDVDMSTAIPFVAKKSPSICAEKIAGIQWHEGKVILRIDHDLVKGAHFNLEDFRPGKSLEIAIPLEGGRAAVEGFLALLNNPESLAAAAALFDKKATEFKGVDDKMYAQYKKWLDIVLEVLTKP